MKKTDHLQELRELAAVINDDQVENGPDARYCEVDWVKRIDAAVAYAEALEAVVEKADKALQAIRQIPDQELTDALIRLDEVKFS